MVGRKVFGGQSSFLPLKVNYAGVMPVIFASAILMFPAQLLRTLGAAIADSPNETNCNRASQYFCKSWLVLLPCLWRFDINIQLLLGFDNVQASSNC